MPASSRQPGCRCGWPDLEICPACVPLLSDAIVDSPLAVPPSSCRSWRAARCTLSPPPSASSVSATCCGCPLFARLPSARWCAAGPCTGATVPSRQHLCMGRCLVCLGLSWQADGKPGAACLLVTRQLHLQTKFTGGAAACVAARTATPWGAVLLARPCWYIALGNAAEGAPRLRPPAPPAVSARVSAPRYARRGPGSGTRLPASAAC